MSKKRIKLKLPKAALEYADVDYLDKLGPEDRKWMMEFIDGYYNNNHRKYEMFTEHPDYEEMKPELYAITNKRNVCGMSEGYKRNNTVELDSTLDEDGEVRLSDLLKDSYTDRFESDIIKLLGMKTIEESLEHIIDETLHNLSDYNRDHRLILVRFYLEMRSIIKEEKRIRVNDRKIEKENSPK